jgi:hypothetical protein
MTARNKKIMWWSAGAIVVALVLLYLFCPPVHKWGNTLLGRNEKELPKPDTTKVDEFEYGRPVEEIEVETIDVPRDSMLDSLAKADSILAAGLVRPLDGPPPTHVPGFGEGPLPPAPSTDAVPNTTDEGMQQVTPATVGDLELKPSSIAVVNNRINMCRNKYNKLVDLYEEWAKRPTAEMQEIGIKLKEELLTDLTMLMKLSQKHNDEEGMEAAADLRREVNKMNF